MLVVYQKADPVLSRSPCTQNEFYLTMLQGVTATASHGSQGGHRQMETKLDLDEFGEEVPEHEALISLLTSSVG